MSDRWRRVGELFDQAVAAPPADRAGVLNGSADPDDVKEEVRSLLAAHDAAEGFLESPASSSNIDAPALAPGARVGTYRVLREIGRGGMGIVYEAEDTRLHRRVALKSLPANVARDEHQRQRLRHEARAAAALQHPGIATVYALEELDGEVFIATEYLPGETLRDELRGGPLGPERGLAAAIEIARALCAAHERGIVHRDLKPENIVRTADGQLKILDFGVAQFDAAASDLASRSHLTLAGTMVGTPAYMAPEQLLGHQTDFHVDHFAFGVLLYELCTGNHPFAADSLPSTIARVLAAPAPAAPNADIPPRVWSVIERCLQKAAAERFATTRDLLDALVASSDPVTAASTTPAGFSLTAASRSAVSWWRFHQLAAALAYWALVWPVWHVHRSLGRAGLFFFFAVLAMVVIAGNLRLHLWFSSRVYPEDLPAQRAEVSRWIRFADVGFAALLVLGGIALPDDRAGWAALLISFGIGAAVSFVFIEPATTRAAFRHWPQR